MTVSKRQVNHVLKVKGHAFIAPADMPNLGQRYAETYIRRRLYALEDDGVLAIYRLYQHAHADISHYAIRRADELGIGKLQNNGASLQWRRSVIDYAEARLSALIDAAGRLAFHAAVLAYEMSFYGRLWQLDGMTPPDVNIRVPNINGPLVSKLVLNSRLIEAVSFDNIGDDLIYRLLGKEWQQAYQNSLLTLIPQIRTALTRSLYAGADVRGSMRAVAKAMGVVIDRRRTTIPNVRANFNRVQTLTRSYIIGNSNEAAMNAYKANADVIPSVEFLPSNDGRVCPTCEGYRGQSWPLDSPDIIRPVYDTHPNCRCALIPVLTDNLLGALQDTQDQQPRDSFESWLVDIGLGVLMDQLTQDRQIDSTQVDPFFDLQDAAS